MPRRSHGHRILGHVVRTLRPGKPALSCSAACHCRVLHCCWVDAPQPLGAACAVKCLCKLASAGCSCLLAVPPNLQPLPHQVPAPRSNPAACRCGPCRVAFPHLSQLAQKHRSKGLVVVGVNMEEDSPQIRAFVQQQVGARWWVGGWCLVAEARLVWGRVWKRAAPRPAPLCSSRWVLAVKECLPAPGRLSVPLMHAGGRTPCWRAREGTQAPLLCMRPFAPW